MGIRLMLTFVAVLFTGTANAQNFQNIIGGLINSAMQANNQTEWKKLPELTRQCMLAASQSNIRFQQALQQGAISPLDPRIAPLRAKCDEIVDRPMRKNFECTFQQPGQSITTYCDEFYARKGQDGSLVKLSIEEVIQLAASGQPIATAQFERQDALARRGQMAAAAIVASKVVSPSFNCASAKTKSEQTICSSYQLSELDSRYGEYFAKSRSFDRKGELRKQLTPINKRRQECQNNTGCIKEQLEAGIDKIAAVLAQNGVPAPTIAELEKVKAAEVEQARKVIAEREQAAREAARVAREAKEAQEKAKRDDDDRRLAVARAEAEKAKAEREKALALAQIEIEKAKATAQVEAEKAKAKAAADAAQAKADADQKRAQAEAERAKAEAEKARIAQEEEDRKNSLSGRISSWFGGNKPQQQVTTKAEKEPATEQIQIAENSVKKAKLFSTGQEILENLTRPNGYWVDIEHAPTPNVSCNSIVGVEGKAGLVFWRIAKDGQTRYLLQQPEMYQIIDFKRAMRVRENDVLASSLCNKGVYSRYEFSENGETLIDNAFVEDAYSCNETGRAIIERWKKKPHHLHFCSGEPKMRGPTYEEWAKQFENPYVATISCEFQGLVVSLEVCFVGKSGVRAELEIRDKENHRFFQGSDIPNVGKRTREGTLQFYLDTGFDVRVQNGYSEGILSLKIAGRTNGKIYYSRSVGSYGTISVKE